MSELATRGAGARATLARRATRLGAAAGLAELEKVAHDPRLACSNLVPSVRADLLRRAGRHAEAGHWYRVAFEYNNSEPGRAFLQRRIVECEAQ